MNRKYRLFKLLSSVLLIMVAGCSGGAQIVGVQPGIPPSDASLAPHLPGQVLVRVVPKADRVGLATSVAATILVEIPRINVLLLSLSGQQSIVDAIKILQASKDVVYAEPNYLGFIPEDGRPTTTPSQPLPRIGTAPGPLFTPSDPAYPAKLWGLVKIAAATAWDTTTGGSNVVIAVLDSGVDSSHPDLAGKVLTGANCFSGTCISGGTTDTLQHGTHVSGTAAAIGNNGNGVAGVAFNNATQILPVKVCDPGCPASAQAAAIIWAADTINSMGKSGVLNMSLGGPGYDQAVQDAVAYANGLGGGRILVVVATGNDFKRYATTYPASLTGVMAVGATDGNDNKASFSNAGPHISVSAPGVDIYSTIPGNGYGYLMGTSMASPHVAGVAALVWSANPTFTNYQVRRKVEVSATDLGSSGWDESFGWGRLNAGAAVTGSAPTPFYGCAFITVQTAGPTAQPGADVTVAMGSTRRATKTNDLGGAVFDFLPNGTYTVTASKVIGGIGNYGSGTVLVSPTIDPNACGTTTITMAP